MLNLLFAAALAAGSPAPVYLGTWRIAGSQSAPWVEPGETFGRSDIDKLDGRMVTFTKRSIAAPAPLACTGPRYALKEVPPEGLFQGNLSDPASQAKALGYGPTVRTLETGCEGLIEFHFIDRDHALFALNNRLYRLERVARSR
jgi:hypothetical protein